MNAVIFSAPPQRARQRAADLNMMPADRLHIEHGVKAHHAVHPRRRLVHQLGDVVDRFGSEMAELLLRQIKTGNIAASFFG